MSTSQRDEANSGQHYRQDIYGETVFSNQGGPQYIYQQVRALEDLFAGGIDALSRRLYQQAVQKFEEYLMTAYPGVRKPPEKDAAAHYYAALAIIGGYPPTHRTPDEIHRVNTHLHYESYSKPNIKIIWRLADLRGRVAGMGF